MAKAKAKRTGGTWFVRGRTVVSAKRPTLPICELPQGGIMHTAVDAANALFICLAVNSHDELVNACERAAQELLRAATGKPPAHNLIDLHMHLKGVILTAKGQ